jgi:hypothetical protein
MNRRDFARGFGAWIGGCTPSQFDLQVLANAFAETGVSSGRSCPMIERQSDLHAGVAEWQTQRT